MNHLTELDRVQLARAIAESDIANCLLENEDIDALVDLFEAWLERRSSGRNWCAECNAKTERLSTFMEGWLKIVHEQDCQWAKVFAMPLGEHLIFVGSGAFMST